MGVQWQGALAKGNCARILTYIVSDTKIESHTFWSFVLQLPYIYTPFGCYKYLKVFVVVMWVKLYIENITLLYVKKFKLFDNKVDIYLSNKMNLSNQNFSMESAKTKKRFFDRSKSCHMIIMWQLLDLSNNRFYQIKKKIGFKNSLNSPITLYD